MKSELYDLKYSRPEAELFIWTPTQEHLSLSLSLMWNNPWPWTRLGYISSFLFLLIWHWLPPSSLLSQIPCFSRDRNTQTCFSARVTLVFDCFCPTLLTNRKNTLARFVQIHNISFTFLSKHVCESQTVMTVYSGLDSDASSTWSFSRGKKEENSSVLLSFFFYYFTTTVWGFSNSFVSLRAMWVLCRVHCMMGISTIIVIYLSLGWANILGAAISL